MMHRGFTLIQISILLTLASLVLVATLPSTQSTLIANRATIAKMNAIVVAMRTYMSKNGSIPCPADATIAISGTNYGVAASGTGATNNCNGTPSANFIDTTNNIAIGMVPVRTLGLSNDYAVDAYGHTITYGVDTNATACWASTTLTGKILVADDNNTLLTNSLFALVSHGQDGHGAWIPVPGTGATGTASRLNAGSTDTDQLVNAHLQSSGTFPNATTSAMVTDSGGTSVTFVRKPATTTFDDLVVYGSNLWNMNVLPQDYTLLTAPTVTGPNAGNYIFLSLMPSVQQTITLTATYSQNVTVTGTPEIGILLGSNMRYATYASGSGTATLTFQYQMVPADSASGGLVAQTPITLNGGTITPTGGSCVATLFSPPSLLNVYVSAPAGIAIDTSSGQCTNECVDIMDTNNSRLVKWAKPTSGTASYLAQAGSNGTSGATFNNPGGIATSTASPYYTYTSDTGNNRIAVWSNSSATPAYVTAFGSAGSTAGLFNSPTGIALDTTTNCAGGACLWIADTGNNQIQRCSLAGACTIVTSGTYNSLALSSPMGIAVDSSNNVYVADSGNNRILKFSSTGVYAATFGSSGTTAGSFASPTGIAVDTTTNCTGSTACLWIADTNNNQLQRCSVNMNGGTACTIYTNSLITPTGVAWDGTYVFVIDQGNSRVQSLKASTSAWQSSFGSAYSGIGSNNSNFNF